MKILVNHSFVIFIDLNHILLDRAFEYMQKCQNVPCVWYQIKIQQCGKTSEFTFNHVRFTFPLCDQRQERYYLLALSYICKSRKCSMLL